MTIRLRSNDYDRSFKKRNPVYKSIQGFIFSTYDQVVSPKY
jgi:hypothetical protein